MKKVRRWIWKTIMWGPAAIMELMQGELAPDIRSALLSSVIGTAAIVAFICLLTLWTQSITGLMTYPYLFAAETSVAAYLGIGMCVRYILADRGLLR